MTKEEEERISGMENVNLGDNIQVELCDGTIMRGEVIKVGANHFVLNEDRIFGDWVFIYFCNVSRIMKL